MTILYKYIFTNKHPIICNFGINLIKLLIFIIMIYIQIQSLNQFKIFCKCKSYIKANENYISDRVRTINGLLTNNNIVFLLVINSV